MSLWPIPLQKIWWHMEEIVSSYEKTGIYQYPTGTRITLNAKNPMKALIGIVRIHAHKIRRATPHFTVLAPLVVPTPMMDVQMMWVVLTGIPSTEAPMIVEAPAVSAAKPCTGRSFVIL